MADLKLLDEAIKESGMTITALSYKTGILRPTMYNRLKGKGEFTGSEITAIAKALRLTNAQRDKIFLS